MSSIYDVCAKCGQTRNELERHFAELKKQGVFIYGEGTGVLLYCSNCNKAFCGRCQIDLGISAGCPICQKELVNPYVPGKNEGKGVEQKSPRPSFLSVIYWIAIILVALAGVVSSSSPSFASLGWVFPLPLFISSIWSGFGELRKKRKVNFGIILKLLMGIILGVVIFFNAQRSNEYYKSEQPFIALAKNACLGKANSNAAAYVANSLFHPIILLDQKGEDNGWHTVSYDWGWEPKSPQDLQLVACIEEKKVKIAECYRGGRYQNVVHAQVVSIKTGIFVDEKDFSGSMPGPCPDTGYETTGGIVYYDDVKAWLTKYVNPQQK